jgi:hypothetical protein
MVKRGILSLQLTDNVVLTDMAYEKANQLGMKLLRERPDNPPAAPVRPYISQQSFQPAAPVQRASSSAGQGGTPAQPGGTDLQQRIRSAVVARLGNQVDANLLNVIIKRVLQNTGIK